MPQSYKEYTGSALTATTFSVPFKYLSINDVNALGFDGTKWNALALDSSTPRDATNKTITLAAAPNTLYTTLRLYRATSTTQLIDFQNGSRLSESDLDAAYQQSLFVAQEIAEDASTSQFTAVAAASLQAGTSLSNFASEEIVSDATNGLINGTNAVFNITAFTPQTTVKEAYRVSIDGVMQSPTDAYSITISPAQITFTSAPPTGSKIVVVTAASAASAVSVDDVTIGLTSANKAQVKDGGITPAKLSAGAPSWNNTNNATQLSIEGTDNGSGEKVAGLEINSNLVGSDGYSFIDFHSKSATNPDFDARIYNDASGHLTLQNKTQGAGTFIKTTNSSGVLSNTLKVAGDGKVTTPDATVSDITEDKQLTTKEYVDGKGITQTTGTAPYYGVRAWANYNGVTDTLKASGNIASVVRNSTGNYTFTFTTAMPDANYSLTMGYDENLGSAGNGHGVGYISSQTTTAFTVRIYNENNSNDPMNKDIVNISVIR